MAQLVEHMLGKHEVPGPNPGSSSKHPRGFSSGLWFYLGVIDFAVALPRAMGCFGVLPSRTGVAPGTRRSYIRLSASSIASQWYSASPSGIRFASVKGRI